MDAVNAFFMTWLDLKLLAIVAGGTFAGIYVGAIPGLSVTMAVSILISFTFSWDLYPALALMIGVFMGGVYGGSRTAILLNIPGAPAAIATALDGYPLALKGEAGEAIGVSTVVSFFGCLFGIFILMIGAPTLSKFALTFQPRDFMLLGIMGLMLVGALSGESLAKGIFSGALGLLIGTVGLDPLTAQERFTFGYVSLWSGINFVAVMIGLFGVSEVLDQMHHIDKQAVRQKISRIIPSWASVKRYFWLGIQSSGIGVVIGALPGTGGDIAALMAYDHATRVVKDPEVPFGQGAKEGLVAPESANNAAVGGAFIPMLTLGIPGDAVTAIMIGALYIHGLQPGPMLMIRQPDMFWVISGALVLASFFMLVFGLTGIRIFVKVVEMPRAILFPLIMLLSIVGSYALNNSLMDVYWMLAFGVFGYFLKMYGFQAAPIILGIILSRLIDENWRRAILSERGDFGTFLVKLVGSPLSMALVLIIVFAVVVKMPFYTRWRNRNRRA